MTEMYTDTEMLNHLISLGHDERSAEAAIDRYSDDLPSGGFRCYFGEDAAMFSAAATKIAKQTAKSDAWFAANPDGNPLQMDAE